MSGTKRRRKGVKVALAYQLGAPHQERITHGVLHFAQENGPIEIVTSPEGASLPLPSLLEWNGDGVIAMLETESQVALARELPFPVVNIASSIPTPGIPTVTANQRAIGELAAEHLLEKNFRRFGFYGLQHIWYSEQRLAGFRDRLSREGYEVQVFETESSLLAKEPWKLDLLELGNWLQGLQTPAAVFAAHDYRARIVLQRCRELGMQVPIDLGIVGVDDDPVVCEFGEPTLSSIRQDGREVGYRAAHLLKELIDGRNIAVDRTTVLVEPVGLVERDSTEVVAVEDPALRRALDLIRSNCRRPVDVAWLVSETGISRRRLENLFRRELAKTPHQCLSEERVRLATSLLRKEKNVPLKEVAARSGFSEPRRMTIVFERITGRTPREYRDGVADAGS